MRKIIIIFILALTLVGCQCENGTNVCTPEPTPVVTATPGFFEKNPQYQFPQMWGIW